MITPADQFTYSSTATNDYYFQWYDKASTGMNNDNIHLLNTSGSTANITVSVPGATAITKSVAAGAATYVNFPQGTIGGPVKVSSDQPILSSQRVQFYSTFNEVWAAPASAVATASYFNWFDNASAGMLQDNIHVINPGAVAAVVTVSLAGATSQVVTVAPGAGTYVTFPAGTIGGPVKVSSTSPVLSSQRIQFNSSFNEAWSASAAQGAITSYVNWFDKASTGMNNDNIHLLNPGTASASVTVSLPGATSLTATVAAGAETYVNFPAGTIGGPVKVSSSQPILSSQRVVFYSTFNEVWAKDATTAVITGVFTWYDKASTGMAQDNIHIVNPSAATATVTVTVGGTSATPLTITVAAGAETYASFPQGTIGGPVVVSSTQPILASQRVQYFQSFNEVWTG
jgi:2-keto-3-deoxy-6-phosphogluconate aldolase